MTTWVRSDNNPVTTQSFLAIQTSSGERGRVDISQDSPGRVMLCSTVYSVEVKHNEAGDPIWEQRVTLDSHPFFG